MTTLVVPVRRAGQLSIDAPKRRSTWVPMPTTAPRYARGGHTQTVSRGTVTGMTRRAFRL